VTRRPFARYLIPASTYQYIYAQDKNESKKVMLLSVTYFFNMGFVAEIGLSAPFMQGV
jgi:hypothetical protein